MMKKSWFSIFILLLVLAFPQFSFSKNAVRLYLFFSEQKGGLKVEEEIIKPLSKKYPIEVRSFSINQLKNYDLLVKFEKELGVKDKEVPAIVIGDKILGGGAEIRKDLETLMSYSSNKGGSPWPSLKSTKAEEEGWIPAAPIEEERKSGKIIYAAFFYMPGCLHCEEMG